VRIASDRIPCRIKLQLAVVWAAGHFGQRRQPFDRKIDISHPGVNHRHIRKDSRAIDGITRDRSQLDRAQAFRDCLLLALKSGVDETNLCNQNSIVRMVAELRLCFFPRRSECFPRLLRVASDFSFRLIETQHSREHEVDLLSAES
jgi:hypothetical protein